MQEVPLNQKYTLTIKEFAFECGLVGRAPRGWVVYDHETGDGIAYDAWDGTERIGDYRDPQYY